MPIGVIDMILLTILMALPSPSIPVSESQDRQQARRRRENPGIFIRKLREFFPQLPQPFVIFLASPENAPPIAARPLVGSPSLPPTGRTAYQAVPEHVIQAGLFIHLLLDLIVTILSLSIRALTT